MQDAIVPPDMVDTATLDDAATDTVYSQDNLVHVLLQTTFAVQLHSVIKMKMKAKLL